MLVLLGAFSHQADNRKRTDKDRMKPKAAERGDHIVEQTDNTEIPGLWMKKFLVSSTTSPV